MEKITIEASAKLNLSLNIEGKREDGYHLLSSVFQSIDLRNVLTAESYDGFLFICDDKSLPTDERNTAVKAVEKFCERARVSPDIKLTLSKKIPYGAGMGSASSDAAAALLAMKMLYPNALTDEEILEIGAKVGADVPFSYTGGTAFVEGIGEKISPVTQIPPCTFLIVKPSYSVSTKEAYALVDLCEGIRTDNALMLSAFSERSVKDIAKNMDNAFYYCLNYEKNREIRQLMIKNGALNATLTGSGSAVFGIFEDEEKALKAKENIPGSFIAHPSPKALYIR